MGSERHDRILAGIVGELARQSGGPGNGHAGIDVDALATAVERALDGLDGVGTPEDDGKTPDELNSANDD